MKSQNKNWKKLKTRDLMHLTILETSKIRAQSKKIKLRTIGVLVSRNQMPKKKRSQRKIRDSEISVKLNP